jgi:hypothetical protein
MGKKVLFTCFSIFLGVQSIKLIGFVSMVSVSAWYAHIIIAVLVNLFVTGVFAFAGFVYPTQRLLPDFYYDVENISFQKSLYKYLHVEKFRKFLLATVWRKKEMQKTHFDGTKSGIDNLILQSKKSEFGHLVPFIILTCIVFYWVVIGKWEVAIWTFIINVIFNLYPIILQRHHRMRIRLIRQRQNRN